MRLRAGGLTDTPTEQPIPEWWGGASIALPTLPPPIGQTSSVTTMIGRLCLTGNRQAAGPSLHLSADGLDFAGQGGQRGKTAGEADGTASCTALVNP